MDHTHRFDGKGAVYARSRPQYAEGLLEYLKSTLGITAGSVFADVGSGTGIFTAQLLACGCRVFAVEPNDDMRKQAEGLLAGEPRFCSVSGSADNTGLPDQSVDFVSAAQAFHWFAPETFRKECRRILRPGGRVLLVYNCRDENAACTRALAALQRRYGPAFRGFSNGMNEETCLAFFTGACQIYRTANTQYYNRQGYLDRVSSSSHSPKETDARYAAFQKELHVLFDRFATDGKIAVPTDTVAYIGSVF